MSNLLLFFALPIATIILAVVLEKILNSPALTAATFFAIYLVITFAVNDLNLLVYTIAYTILAYIAAIIADYIFGRIEQNEENNTCCCNNRSIENNNEENEDNFQKQNIRNIGRYRFYNLR